MQELINLCLLYQTKKINKKDTEEKDRRLSHVSVGQSLSDFFNLISEALESLEKKDNSSSDKHSDLYTDENPKGTIHGLGFKDVETARASVKKLSILVDHTHIKLKTDCNGTKSKSHGKNSRGRCVS